MATRWWRATSPAHGRPWTRPEMETALAHWIALFETRQLGKLRVRRKSDGELVGRAGFGIYAPTGEAEIGYSLYPAHWGNGYAFEAASALRDWYFAAKAEDHFIGLADVRNTASLKVLDRIGMTRTHVGPAPVEQLCQFFNLPAAGRLMASVTIHTDGACSGNPAPAAGARCCNMATRSRS